MCRLDDIVVYTIIHRAAVLVARSPCAQQIGEDAVGAGNELGKLAVQGVGHVNEGSLAGMGYDEAAALRVLAGIGGLGQGGIRGVPGVEERVAALFNPAV